MTKQIQHEVLIIARLEIDGDTPTQEDWVNATRKAVPDLNAHGRRQDWAFTDFAEDFIEAIDVDDYPGMSFWEPLPVWIKYQDVVYALIVEREAVVNYTARIVE